MLPDALVYCEYYMLIVWEWQGIGSVRWIALKLDNIIC